jgi:hypothetical protein
LEKSRLAERSKLGRNSRCRHKAEWVEFVDALSSKSLHAVAREADSAKSLLMQDGASHFVVNSADGLSVVVV